MRISDWSSDVCSSDLAPLKEILNRTHFDGSLETADPARARRLARKISVAMDQLAERMQAMPPSRQPTPGQLNLVLKELFDSLLKDCERRRDQHHRQRREHVDRSEIGLGIVSKNIVDRLIEDERHTRNDEQRVAIGLRRCTYLRTEGGVSATSVLHAELLNESFSPIP